ncbi:arsenate reductase/protein-tyrosine-phosphatase family protein [Herpetosiphon geysericola]|uniref:HTH arsR-type domain-containing protein n=1 Tax=Herpetosiphon geysericola TaxID=70996 RepID=A0A0P6Y1K5_9CHLR|nr:ArsR family transcriptional regulator [Herpetosiphon geysericola]KPL91473.1 hypothetical protein SE18_02150 [Herpetosiphon geysericola]
MHTSLTDPAPPILHLLAHDIRWNLAKALAGSDYRVGELATLIQQPLKLISYHLRQLRDGQLVHERRSTADGRDLYYSLDLAHIEAVYQLAGATLHPCLGDDASAPRHAADATHAPTRVLFLCTHNSARSQMAEAILRHIGGSTVLAFSAGTEQSTIHPQAIITLAAHGIDTSSQTSKRLDAYAGEHFDYVITVCDRAREICPLFPGDPHQIHWSFPDPAAIAAPLEQARAFEQTYTQLLTRMRFFLTVLDRQRRGA